LYDFFWWYGSLQPSSSIRPYVVLLSAIVVQLLQIDEAKSIVRNKGGEGKCLLAKANLHLFSVFKVQTGKEGNS
jgi:hypothetical protein